MPAHAVVASGAPRARCLVLRPGAIGDTLLALPALAALREARPELSVVMAGNASALPVVAASGLIDGSLSFDDGRLTRLFQADAPAPDDPFAPLTGGIVWGADPTGALRAGLARRGAREIVVAASRPAPDSGVHAARHLVATLGPLGVDPDAPLGWPRIMLPEPATHQAEAELARLGLAGRSFVAIHPGSGSPAKNWPAEQFAAVVRALDERGLSCLVLAGPADAAAVARLAAASGSSRPMLTDLPLLVVAALLTRASAYLGNDSGIAHLAGILGVPTLALFGPTSPTIWAPLGPRVRTLRSDPLDALPASAVLDVLRDSIDRHRGRSGHDIPWTGQPPSSASD